MKINSSDLQSKLIIYQIDRVQGKHLETSSAEKPQTPTSHQDRVALSERWRSIADAQRAVASVPDIRVSLVSQIQTDLQNETYIVDSQKTAEGILRESMVNQAAMM